VPRQEGPEQRPVGGDDLAAAAGQALGVLERHQRQPLARSAGADGGVVLVRIYYRGPLRLLSARRCRLRLSRVASDHLPVVADFKIA